MASIQAKRAYVSDMYPGKRWKNKVKHMSDIQVTAIYLKEQAKQDKPKKETNNDDEIPF
jgi:hypothetical protein